MIRDVLEDARCAPSNSNTQPWAVHIVSGAPRDRLSAALLTAAREGRESLDFVYDSALYPPPYGDWRRAQGYSYYAAMGIARGDRAARIEAHLDNLRFFGAPHVALLFMPAVADNVRVAGDVGMYGQTFLLSLAARGLGGEPQTAVSMFAGTIREELKITPDFRLLFAISFSLPDPDRPAAGWRTDRAAIEESVTFHS
jgi:nitroreductase